MSRRLSIRTLVVLAVLAPILALAAALVSLSIASSRSVAESLAAELIDDTTNHVRTQLRDYLSSAVRISEQYARRIDTRTLPTTNLQAWERPMLEDLLAHPDVASIEFANTAGDATWVLRHGDRLEVGRVVGAGDHAATEYVISPTGQIGREPLRIYQYIAQSRPWYTAALSNAMPVWTALYFWFGDSGDAGEVGTGYTRQVHNPDGSLAGVLVVDTTLRGLSNFLRRLPVSKDGSVFLVDQQGQAVAASAGRVIWKKQRIALSESDAPMARAAAAYLAGPRNADDPAPRIFVDSDPARMHVSDVCPYPGIHWRAVVVIPESTFLAQAQSVQSRALWMAGIAVAGALILGYVLARRLTEPVLALIEHVRRIGGGDFAARLTLDTTSELTDLSEALNNMAQNLRQRMELQHSLAVASHVQQSLLPAASPTSARLDIYGVSRSSNAPEAGALDFIDIGDLPDQRALLAVGDVLGHGIGASLVMDTARAALRATELRPGALGELLTAVNSVLPREDLEQRYMTMLLVLLEPNQGFVRWACAGQKVLMLYEPRANDFIELQGSDAPLGLKPDTVYQEFSFPCLNPHQVLLVGADAIWEAHSAEGRPFGKERLRELIKAAIDLPAADIARTLDRALSLHLGSKPARDDITFVIAKVLAVDTPASQRFSARG